MKVTVKDIAVCAFLAAILFVVQVMLGFLPNIELVSLLVILYTLEFRKKTLWVIYVFAVLEGLVYGFGVWWWMYLYVWTILYFIAGLFRKNNSTLLWALISGIYGLCFGFLCSFPYLIMGGPGAMLSFFISGIPFDLLHGAGNFVVMLVFYKPVRQILARIAGYCERGGQAP